METNGVVLQAERLLGRPWAVVSLSLVFELPDGRHTAPTYISGSGAVTQFLLRFGAQAPDDLLGTVMSVDVADSDTTEPAVRPHGNALEALTTRTPERGGPCPMMECDPVRWQ